ncbi:hypothetical protein F4804DRAFT_3977 [Jackrogersella minutella]|nr:hypothetical protein F4804DRAFT_3977 [Jackrogersella minutella]
MPRFPVTFRRKSTAAEDPNGPVAEQHSFRVLERSEVSNGKSFDGGARLAKMTAAAVAAPKPNNIPELAMEDNLFAGLKNNRGSGSSNTTKTASDNSSRHSNASTAPSSTDYPQQEDWRNSGRKSISMADGPVPPPHKNGGGFLKQAGRTFSFGNKKSHLPTIPAEESIPAIPSMPDEYSPGTPRGRSRAETASTSSTATPPKVEDRDFMLDLGGDLSSMLTFDKRASVATLKDRNLMANRVSQPSPLHLDNTAPIEPPQHSWNSQHSNDGLLSSGRTLTSPPASSEMPPPPVPRHHHTMPLERRRSDDDDEDTTLLRDSIAATQYLSSEASGATSNSNRYRRDEDSISDLRSNLTESYSRSSRFDAKADDENMFDRPVSRPKSKPRLGGRSHTQPQNKVMTPAEFEKYRQDKAREEIMGLVDDPESDKEEEINYDDDEDEQEKTKQLAKQRKKQEAHMTVYRQQMMKVTGESSNANGNANTSNHASHASISMSMSTPNLVLNDGPSKGVSPSPPSDGSESDEEVPLAILAAHGFPNKNRPPTRLTTMSSNPNLRASMAQPSYVAGPGSVVGESSGANGGRLPPFARKLPQDPYLGAGLINQPPRESFALGGGISAPNRPMPNALPTGGLVGVIANEERSRALRRGSPAVDNSRNAFPMPTNGMPMNGGFDPISGIPPQMMYPMGMPQMPNPMLTPGDQAQIQMTQQMQQFMQMQMQFMQMMATQNPGQEQSQNGSFRPQGHMPTNSIGSLGEIPRNSFMGDMMGSNMGNGMNLDLPRSDNQIRTMSMVQPSSASWLQPPNNGYAPSVHAQGAGYAPSIAPSERSNIGLPGRYRPVSSVGMVDHSRTASMSSALPNLHSKLQSEMKVTPVNKEDDDDEQGWQAMNAKREKKRSIWRSKKTFGDDIGALIN